MKNYIELPFLINQLLADGCLTVEDRRVRILIEKLDAAPLEVQMDDLEILYSQHAYGCSHRVESIEFFAKSQQYWELGLFILIAVLVPRGMDRIIHLMNKKSKIKVIRILGSNYWCQESDLNQNQFDLEFSPEHLKKHPWVDIVDAWDLPIFNRSNEADFCRNEKDWDSRDWLVLAGKPKSNIRLGQLLLNLGHQDNCSLEVALEVEGGFRGVGPLSSEARFWLPGSFGWDQFSCHD